MTRAILRRLALPLAATLLCAFPSTAQQPASEYEGVAALGLELRRLGTIKRVLMIGAHPDDESTQILSTLALGQGADVAYLSLTRGEGGQNGIGPELQEGLGLLRTEELLAARRLDGARQYFTRAYDFGFSKDSDEAFRHWPRELVLADVVAVIRHFRPDVVLSIFSGTTRDGHGQHQVAGILAQEAFTAAADPARFPEQMARGLLPFAPSRFFRALWGDSDDAGYRLETGELDPILGRSYYQVAMASRSRHRSQDMGRPLTPGPQVSLLQPAGDGAHRARGEGSLFAGIDTTLSARVASVGALSDDESDIAAALPLLIEYDRTVLAVREGFNPLVAGGSIPRLAEALRLVRAGAATLPVGELHDLAAAESRDAEAALWRAGILVVDAIANAETVVPGEELELELSLWNGGDRPVAVHRLEPSLPIGWTAVPTAPLEGELPSGTLLTRTFRVTLPAAAVPTRPYFLLGQRDGDLYRWPDRVEGEGASFAPPEVRAVAEVTLAGQRIASQVEGTFRQVDSRQGESRRPVRVVPAVSVRLTPGVAVAPLTDSPVSPIRFTVQLRSESAESVAGNLTLRVPDGFVAEPATTPVHFERIGETRAIEVVVRPPGDLREGAAEISAEFAVPGGSVYREGFELIDYPHIRPQPLYHPARTSVRSFPISAPEGLHVGYVAGAGDDAPDALRQLGIRVTLIDAARLAAGELDDFDAILTGIRAYEVNRDLIAHNRRLLEYAERGGTVVVQYNKYEYTDPGVAPFPVQMARPHGRVTDEAAAVHLLSPEHPALNWPNRITGADFEGWVQERGLYFLETWDDRFVPLLEMADPGEQPQRGSLLVAPLGDGIYVYSGLAFFRQLPEGVPGAYRLLVNLLSLGSTP